jgi:hypothetical protein
MSSQDIYVNISELGLNTLPKDQWADGVQEDMIQRLTDYVKTAKRGDTISLQKRDDKYRNVWTYLWDGEKAVELDHSIDEYGAVSRTLKVTDTEFSPDWLSDEIKSRMVFKKENGQIFADFLISSIMWCCYVDNPEEVESIDDIATRKNAYFQLCEAECSVPSSPYRPHVMYLYFTQ